VLTFRPSCGSSNLTDLPVVVDGSPAAVSGSGTKRLKRMVARLRGSLSQEDEPITETQPQAAQEDRGSGPVSWACWAFDPVSALSTGATVAEPCGLFRLRGSLSQEDEPITETQPQAAQEGSRKERPKSKPLSSVLGIRPSFRIVNGGYCGRAMWLVRSAGSRLSCRLARFLGLRMAPSV
jgi:hypothetical protein